MNKYRSKKIIFFILFLMFSYIIPFLAVVINYNLFKLFWDLSLEYKLTIVGSILVLFTYLYFKDKIDVFVNRMSFGIYKCVISGFVQTTSLIAVILLVLYTLETGTQLNLAYAAGWVLGCNILSLFLFEPLWKHYSRLEKENK